MNLSEGGQIKVKLIETAITRDKRENKVIYGEALLHIS